MASKTQESSGSSLLRFYSLMVQNNALSRRRLGFNSPQNRQNEIVIIIVIIYGEVAQRQRQWTCLIVGTLGWVSTSIRHQKSIQCGFKSHPLYHQINYTYSVVYKFVVVVEWHTHLSQKQAIMGSNPINNTKILGRQPSGKAWIKIFCLLIKRRTATFSNYFGNPDALVQIQLAPPIYEAVE